MKNGKTKKQKTVIPASTPRNPTVVPMLSITKPGRHKDKRRERLKDDYYR